MTEQAPNLTPEQLQKNAEIRADIEANWENHTPEMMVAYIEAGASLLTMLA